MSSGPPPASPSPPDPGLRAFRRLVPILRPYRASLAVGTVAILATTAAQGWAPVPFQRAVDALGGRAPDTSLATGWAMVFLAVTGLRGATQWVMRRLIVAVSREMERDLRDQLYAKVVRQSPAWIGTHATGDLMSRFTSDVEAVRMSAGPGLMYVVSTVSLLPWALWAMFSMSPTLAWLNLIPLAVLAGGTRFVAPRMHAASTATQEAQGALSTRAQESFAGVRVVKSFAREAVEAEGFRRAAETALAASIRVADVQAFFYPLIGLLKWLGFVLTIFVGGRMMARGELTLGTFLAFHLFAGMLLWPMISLGWVLALWQRGRVAMARINVILDAPRGIDDPDAPQSLGPSPRGEIEIRGLTFAHSRFATAAAETAGRDATGAAGGGAAPALSDVSLRVPAGRTVALVGATGSGKSTLLATIPRLLEAPPGTVLVDGVPVERLALVELRALIGYVPQDTFLFSDTVGANIALGLPDGAPADEAPLRRAASDARVLEEIERLPSGFDTLLGERGVNLSGGQRQRTAIARALVRDPKILLLDDCLSAVDAKTESEILANLRGVLRGRTTLLVTHRASAARLADEIVVLEEGRVVERGTPEALAAADGRFAALARRQSLEEALEAA